MDRLTPAQRSRVMAAIHGKDTGIERLVRSELHRRGLRFRKHVKGIRGRPDIVFRGKRLVVFVDGDFWHGYRFPQWRHKLTPTWQVKIQANRERDARNFRHLRRQGWRVIRLWEHEIKANLPDCVERVVRLLEAGVVKLGAQAPSRRPMHLVTWRHG
jgi:DNA mismatch endonuclease (patch repair protein)